MNVQRRDRMRCVEATIGSNNNTGQEGSKADMVRNLAPPTVGSGYEPCQQLLIGKEKRGRRRRDW